MDSATEKTLRRACARFKTGIYRKFKLEGHMARIDPEQGHNLRMCPDPDYCENYHSIREAILIVWDHNSIDPPDFADLVAVTPEVVYRAYLQSQVEAVHEH